MSGPSLNHGSFILGWCQSMSVKNRIFIFIIYRTMVSYATRTTVSYDMKEDLTMVYAKHWLGGKRCKLLLG
jgi:hypothetical protein